MAKRHVAAAVRYARETPAVMPDVALIVTGLIDAYFMPVTVTPPATALATARRTARFQLGSR